MYRARERAMIVSSSGESVVLAVGDEDDDDDDDVVDGKVDSNFGVGVVNSKTSNPLAWEGTAASLISFCA